MDNPNQPNANASIMSVGDWIITILITAIPVINIIMLFVWGFSSSTNPNKANWAKATLVWMAIGIVLWIIFGLIFGVAIFSGMQESGNFENF